MPEKTKRNKDVKKAVEKEVAELPAERRENNAKDNWSADQRTLFFNAALPSGTTITFILNSSSAPQPDASAFRDAGGTVLMPDTLSATFLVP